MNFFISLAITFFKEFISPQALLYLVILGMLFWIKFNCLATITDKLKDIVDWQTKHEKRSDNILKQVNTNNVDIEGLKKGKIDK